MGSLLARFGATLVFVTLFHACSLQGPLEPRLMDFLDVLPWDGHAGAVSLTFDDGMDSHLNVVIPELDIRKIPGSFFLISNRVEAKGTSQRWRSAASIGHELANHTASHPMLSTLSSSAARAEIDTADLFLSNLTGQKVVSFAYPYCNNAEGDYLISKYAAARGIARKEEGIYVLADQEPNWTFMPSVQTLTQTDPTDYISYIQGATLQKAWIIFQVHGVGDPKTNSEWQTIPTSVFTGILDSIHSQPDLWVGTFGEISSYSRGRFSLNSVATTQFGDSIEFVWKVPAWCTQSLRLRAKMNLGLESWTLKQGGSNLNRETDGTYLIKYDLGNLSLIKG